VSRCDLVCRRFSSLSFQDAIHQNLPPCPKKWVNTDELEATVELTVDRGRSIDRDEVMKIMMRNGVDRGDYLGSYQLERFDIWYVILENAMVAEEFVRKNPYLFVEERDDKEGVAWNVRGMRELVSLFQCHG
jgi:hypothetical protein